MGHGSHTRRIYCEGFAADEVLAVKSLLGLLGTHLRQRWEVSECTQTAFCLGLYNLDVVALPAAPAPGAAVIAGCALRPQWHGRGVLHRPVRAAQLLRVLQKLEAGSQEARTPRAHPQAGEIRCYRLVAWPIDLQDWPEPQWPLLAALAAGELCRERLRAQTGADASAVDACLQRLDAAGLVDTRWTRDACSSETRAPTGAWRALSGRLMRILGVRP